VRVSTAPFASRYGPWAVVAGASEGLGAEFARQLAARGLHLVLIARRSAPLEQHARAVADAFGVQTRTLAIDLASPDLLPALRERIVYNAAQSVIGPYLEQDLAAHLRMIDVNCRAPVVLVHELGRAMAARGRGGIILMSSIAGLQGSALIATYAATKAFDLVLGEALWEELRGRGVDVLAFLAGATRTPNFEGSNPQTTSVLSAPMEPEPVVREALAALGTRPSAVAGRINRLSAFVMTRLLPRRRAVETIGKAMRARYAR
jgi:short-subunit dehydrogenase